MATDPQAYDPGPATGARVHKDGDRWTLILVRDLHHPPNLVWEALTDPAHLAEWAPFDANRNLSTVGPVTMSMAGTPKPQVFETAITRADAPHVLEYSWGESDLRWQLEPLGDGTRLTLWHNIDRRFIAWGAAGWHICFEVLDRLLSGLPRGRIVRGHPQHSQAWQRLIAEYAAQFEAEPASEPSKDPT